MNAGMMHQKVVRILLVTLMCAVGASVWAGSTTMVLICSLGTQTFLALFYQKPRECDMIYL
ncbi:MAG: hypothetical protein WA705_20260 [Candidatus Ozemobacteraceae bacterium]